MNKILNLINKNKIVFICSTLVIVSFVIVLLNKGTQSADYAEPDLTGISCPETAIKDETIECSITVNTGEIIGQGISVKYNISDGIEFVDFISENWEIYASDEDGFVLVNLNGLSGNVSVGTVRFTMPTDALPNEIYQIELTDITVGDGDETIANLDNISTEIRIKSDINTLDNITLTDATLNETFDKDKTEYTINSEADKITIDVVKTDEHSSVSGDIGEQHIHYGTNSFSIYVTSEEGEVKTYKLVLYKTYNFSSDYYVYNKETEYIYVRTDTDNNSILNNIDIPSELSKKIEDNKLIISYQEEVLKEIKVISISSNTYDLSKEYIYLGQDELDISKITFVNCDNILEDSKLKFKYNDILIEEFYILSISLGELSEEKNVITLNDYLTYSEFVNNITLNGEITYKIINGDEEVTSGNITDEMILKIYYNEEVLDSYNIIVYNLSFDEKLIIDETNGYIKYHKIRSTVSEFLTNVDVVGNVNMFISDSDGEEKNEDDLLKTGDKLTIYIGSKKVSEYLVAVRGDANGDGNITLTDLVQARKHIVGWKNSITGEISKKEGIYYNAIDMNNDGNISLTDLVRIRKLIVGIDIDE